MTDTPGTDTERAPRLLTQTMGVVATNIRVFIPNAEAVTVQLTGTTDSGLDDLSDDPRPMPPSPLELVNICDAEGWPLWNADGSTDDLDQNLPAVSIPDDIADAIRDLLQTAEPLGCHDQAGELRWRPLPSVPGGTDAPRTLAPLPPADSTAGNLGAHPTADAGSFRFDWQASDRQSFLHWLLPTVIPASQQPDLVDRLSKATDKFTNVELTILVNGIPVNAQGFLDGVERNMDHHALVAARRLLNEVGGNGEFEKLETLLRETTRTARLNVERRLAEAGYDLPDYED